MEKLIRYITEMTKKKMRMYLSRISSPISKQRKRVWMFIGMMTAYGGSLTVNSSLTLKSNSNVMGGKAMPRDSHPRVSLLENMEMIKSTPRVIS